MPVVKEKSTLERNTITIGIIITIVISCLFLSKAWMNAYLYRKFRVDGFLNVFNFSNGWNLIELTIAFICFFLILINISYYLENRKSIILFFMKCALCISIGFVLAWIIPGIDDKIAAGEIRDDRGIPFLVSIGPFLFFWFILHPHKEFVWERSFYEGDVIRGARAIHISDSENTTNNSKPNNLNRKFIKIIKTPIGYAPEEIRDKWVGVILPLEEEYFKPQKIAGISVYQVDALEAVEILKHRSPEAAKWWRVNSPDLFDDGLLGFPTECCEFVSEEKASSTKSASEDKTENPKSNKEKKTKPEGDIPNIFEEEEN